MGYMGLSHWGESDNAADLKFVIEKSIQKLIEKELKHKDNEFNTDGFTNIALLLEDGIFSLQCLTYDQVKFLIDGLKNNLKSAKQNENDLHINAYTRLLKFVKKEFDKYKDDLYV